MLILITMSRSSTKSGSKQCTEAAACCHAFAAFAKIRFFAVRTHAHVPNFDCHNLRWWMDWLDAMSVLTHVYAAIIAP
jgi:hypothetical protein